MCHSVRKGDVVFLVPCFFQSWGISGSMSLWGGVGYLVGGVSAGGRVFRRVRYPGDGVSGGGG